MKSKLFIALLLLAAFTSFKKTAADFRIKKVVSFKHPQDSSTYSYTTEGKIAEFRTTSPPMWQRFKYEGNKIIEEGDGPTKGHPFKNTFYVNRKGLVDSMKRVADTMKLCFYFKYDKNGYRTEEYSGCDKKTLEIKRVIENGNMTKQIFYENGQEYETAYFEYFTDKPNQSTMFGEEKLGYGWRGKDSKNLMKKLVIVASTKDTVLVNISHYHFDNKGRITVHAIYGKTGSLADSVKYSY